MVWNAAGKKTDGTRKSKHMFPSNGQGRDSGPRSGQFCGRAQLVGGSGATAPAGRAAGRGETTSRASSRAAMYKDATTHDARRALARSDLFFLMTEIMGRKDMDNDWCFARCNEVCADPDGFLDLWAREHYKSTIITVGKTIQDILVDPEITVGIFSHTRPIAKSFLRQIKREMETNVVLQDLFPDILFKQPKREAPQWSEDGGIIVKRETNPKEATIEAWGLVDGQPIGKHFSLLIYDDVVTRESVSTPEMIAKVTDAWALSLNLGAHGGRRRMIGTRYHFNDTYKTVMDRCAAAPRIYPATVDGSPEGEGVFLDGATLAAKRRDMGPYIFGCQMLQNPLADAAQGFKREWIRFYTPSKHPGANRGGGQSPSCSPFANRGDGQSPSIAASRGAIAPSESVSNIYILVDPAGAKKRDSDYSVLWVLALGDDGNIYLVDGVRDRLNLTERTAALFRLHRKWRPSAVGYEQYGMQADIEHIRYVMEQEGYRFTITALAGSMPKNDRIRRLVPVFEQARFFLPEKLPYAGADGRSRDLVEEFIEEEFVAFPVSGHDDMLDCASRILDPAFPARVPLRARPTEEARRNMCVTDYDPASY